MAVFPFRCPFDVRTGISTMSAIRTTNRRAQAAASYYNKRLTSIVVPSLLFVATGHSTRLTSRHFGFAPFCLQEAASAFADISRGKWRVYHVWKWNWGLRVSRHSIAVFFSSFFFAVHCGKCHRELKRFIMQSVLYITRCVVLHTPVSTATYLTNIIRNTEKPGEARLHCHT